MGSIIEVRKATVANNVVDLLLCLPLDMRMLGDEVQESTSRRDGLIKRTIRTFKNKALFDTQCQKQLF